jgi:hypothetical protein
MKLTKKLLARFCNTALVLLLLASAWPGLFDCDGL